MKVGKVETKNGHEIINVVFKGKEFYRFTGKKVLWKRVKSNHIVKKDLHDLLESTFQNRPMSSRLHEAREQQIREKGAKTPSTFKKTIEKIESRYALDNKLYSMCEEGLLLQAVKLYKDQTGLGLRESKDYVDALNRMYKVRKKFLESNSTDREFLKDSVVNAYFGSAIEKRNFINNIKARTEGKRALEIVKLIKDETSLGLAEAKTLYDNYIA